MISEVPAAIFFFIISVILLLVLVGTNSKTEWQADLAKQGHGRYHPQTGKFELLPMGNVQ